MWFVRPPDLEKEKKKKNKESNRICLRKIPFVSKNRNEAEGQMSACFLGRVVAFRRISPTRRTVLLLIVLHILLLLFHSDAAVFVAFQFLICFTLAICAQTKTIKNNFLEQMRTIDRSSFSFSFSSSLFSHNCYYYFIMSLYICLLVQVMTSKTANFIEIILEYL